MPIIGITGDSSYQSYRGNYDNVPIEVDFGNLEDIYPQFVYASTPQKIEGINAKTEIKVTSGEAKIFVYYDEDEFIFESSEDGSSYYQYIGISTTNTFIKPGANIILFVEATAEGNPINESLFNRIYSNNISIGKLDSSWVITTSSIPSAVGLQFPVAINVPLNSQVISSSYTVSGLLSDVSYIARIISDEGRIRVNSGSNVTNSPVVNGDVIQLVLPQTASTQLTTKQVSVSISAINGAGLAQTTWSITTEIINAASNLSFSPVTNVGFGTTVVSETYVVSGLTSNTTYTGEIVGSIGLFNVNSGINTTRSNVNNNDVIRLFLPQTPLTELTTTSIVFRIFQALDVGDTRTTWNVTTKEKNKNITFTPTDFTDLFDRELDTFYTTNEELIISGLDVNTTLPVTTSNADYRIVRGTTIIKDYNSSDIEVSNNDKITLRMKSSTQSFTDVSTNLTIGNTTINWNIKTKPPSPVFTPSDFIDVSSAIRATQYESNNLTISNIPTGVSYIPTTSSGQYKVQRNGVIIKDYTSAAVSIINGDIITLRNTSSSSYSTTITTTFSVGGTSVTWQITTESSPPSPPSTSPSNFTSVSNALINTNYNSNQLTVITSVPTTISTSGVLSYTVFRGGVSIGSPTSILNGDSISLTSRSSSSYNSTTNSSMTLFSSSGNITRSWSITTGSPPTSTGNISVTHIVMAGEDINKYLYYGGTPISSVVAVISGSSRYYSLVFSKSIVTFNRSNIDFSLTGAEGGSQPTLRIKSLTRTSSTSYILRFERLNDSSVWIETFCRSFDFPVEYFK